MKVKKINFYNLDHEKVNKTLEGDLTFLNDFCVNDEYLPVAVYKAAKPNKKKGHKKYVLLTNKWIRGLSSKEIQPYRYQSAIHCLNCDEVVYSVYRHNFQFCSCEAVSVDGGRDYLKCGFKPGTKYKIVTLDLLTDKIINRRVKNGKSNK